MNFTQEKAGATKEMLSKYISSQEVKSEMHRFANMAVIGLGQGGGRIAAELSKFGMPTYLFNSSQSDMAEHKNLIPEENRILTQSKEFSEFEGTSKNARLGFEIAKENQEAYKKIALSPEIQNADYVWCTVSLGGGTGNGALRVALAFLSAVRKKRQLPNGNIPLGVICSIPSKDEKGSAYRKNALSGVAALQQMVNEKKIGSVLVIDNEKMNDYYNTNPFTTYDGTVIDAKTYSNMVVASLIIETATLPLLQGRSVFDKAEYLDTISTPGWLYLSKYEEDVRLDTFSTDTNTKSLIQELFTKNEVLAQGTTDHVKAGAVGVVYPDTKNISPKVVDDVYRFTAETLNTTVHSAVASNSKIKKVTLYGLSVSAAPPQRIAELQTELEEWEKIEKEQEEKEKALVESLNLEGYKDYLSSDNLRKRSGVADEDIFGDLDFDDNKPKAATLDDLDDLEF